MDIVTLAVIIVVAGAVVVGLVAFFFVRQRREQQQRQERAHEQYGSEYERAVEEHGSEREAEQDLRKRRERLEDEVEPLSDGSRRRYEEEWQRVEKTFVDNPPEALDEADRVVGEILKERNFLTDSREEASKDVGVMHPQVVEDFREAQRIHAGATGSGDGTDLEKMRQAIQKYRAVYERLIER